MIKIPLFLVNILLEFADEMIQCWVLLNARWHVIRNEWTLCIFQHRAITRGYLRLEVGKWNKLFIKFSKWIRSFRHQTGWWMNLSVSGVISWIAKYSSPLHSTYSKLCNSWNSWKASEKENASWRFFHVYIKHSDGIADHLWIGP